MSPKCPTREECLQQVRDLEQRLMEAQATIADLRSRLGAEAPAEVPTSEAGQQLIEELQTSNEELQSQAAELEIQAEELQVQAEELEMQNEELQRVSGELETERALLHTILEQMPAGVIVAAAPSGRFLLANQQMAAIIGRAVPMAKTLADYDHYRALHPDGRPFSSKDYPLAHCLTSGEKTLEEEINFIRADGSQGVIQVSASPVRNAREEIIAGVATYQDITARKQAEKEIQRLASFPQLNPNPVLEVDAAGQITFYNQATQEALGAVDSPEAFLPGDLNEIFLNANRTGENEFQREVQVNGKVFLEAISFAESLNVWRIYAIDITERQRAGAALRQSIKRTTDILESISEGFFSTNKEMVVTYFNNAAARILGRSRDEVLGMQLFDAFPEARGSIFEGKYAEALREGKSLTFEAFFEPEPYQNWYEVRVFPFQDGISVYFQVTTERKKAEAALLRAKEDWERTFNAVPDLITIMDRDHHIIRVNRAMAQAMGKVPEDLTGKACYEFMHESGRIPSICPHQQLLLDGRQHTAELRELNRDFLVTTSPILDDQGRLFGSVHVARDITERKRAEEALRESEEFNRRVIASSADCIKVLDLEGRLLTMSAGGQRLMEIDDFGPYLNYNWLEFWQGNYTEAANAIAAARSGGTGQFQAYCPTVKGTPKWWDVIITPILGPEGKPQRLLSVSRDITSQKAAEEALRQLNEELEKRVQERTTELEETVAQLEEEITDRQRAEQALATERRRFYDVLEMLPAYLVLLTPDYHVAYANRYFTERFGESHGRRCFEYLFSRTEPCEICHTFNVLKTNAPQHWEWTGPDGRYYEIYDYPFTDVGGSPLIMEMGIDITERKQAEKQVETIGRLYRVLSKVNETIIRVPDRETLFQEACRIAVEDGGFRMAWVGLTDPDDRVVKVAAKYGHDQGYLDNLLIPLADVPESRGPTGVAIGEGRYDLCNDLAAEPRTAPWRNKAMARGYHSSGAFPLWVGSKVIGAITLYARTPGFFNKEEIALLEALADDLSFALESMDREVKRRQAEEEVKKLNEELEQRVRERTAQLEAANREMEAFSYSVSHDLKAPIRAIDGFSKMLMAEHAAKLDPEALRLLEVVRHNTGYMAQLIEDLLALSRLGRREIRKTRLDLAALSAAAFKEIKGADPERQIDLTVTDLPPAYGDSSLMRQVLVNLLSNAFKFTKPREDAVIEVGGRLADGENVYYVKDNGVGFDMRYQEKLFGVFQRLHKQGEFEGTGVGLAIVQRILLRHGGRTWAEGKPGEGATFYFALPKQDN